MKNRNVHRRLRHLRTRNARHKSGRSLPQRRDLRPLIVRLCVLSLTRVISAMANRPSLRPSKRKTQLVGPLHAPLLNAVDPSPIHTPEDLVKRRGGKENRLRIGPLHEDRRPIHVLPEQLPRNRRDPRELERLRGSRPSAHSNTSKPEVIASLRMYQRSKSARAKARRRALDLRAEEPQLIEPLVLISRDRRHCLWIPAAQRTHAHRDALLQRPERATGSHDRRPMETLSKWRRSFSVSVCLRLFHASAQILARLRSRHREQPPKLHVLARSCQRILHLMSSSNASAAN